MRRINKDKELLLKEMWEKDIPTIEIAKRIGISRVTVIRAGIRMNLSPRTKSGAKKKYTIKEDIFDKIDTQEKAYFLGYLFADGYNSEERGVVTLSLAEQDYDILVKFNKLVGSNRPIKMIKDKTDKHQALFSVSISNRHISNVLSNLGMVQAKTFKLTFPFYLNDHLIPHFIRGYFDGDGSGTHKLASLASTKEFCLAIKDIMKDKININSRLYIPHKERNVNTSIWISGGRLQAQKFYNYIYKDATIYLSRKYNKVMGV